MSLREILQGSDPNNWAVIQAKQFNKTANVTRVSSANTFNATPSQIFGGLFYAPYSNSPGTCTINFPSISEMDSLFPSPPIGQVFDVTFISGRSQNFSFNIILGVGCVDPIGNIGFATSGAVGAANYYKIIFERQDTAYVFYSYPGI